jgi:hypothetical protein
MKIIVLTILLCFHCSFIYGSESISIQNYTNQVGQWDRFEAEVINPKSYNDPFSDVSLEATYTRPDGSVINFWGFYDGGNRWKLRFMPDQLGKWKFESRFSDGSKGIASSFTCVASTIPGLISRDETNPRWFGFKGGNHILIRSFHCGPLFSIPEDKRKTFLDWAQKQGYNTLGVRGHVNGVPNLWPLNVDTFRQVETVLNDLSDRRMLVWGFWGFFGGRAPREADKRTLYLKYCMARLGPYWNEIFNVGGPEIDKRRKPEEIDALGKEIKRLDVFGHLLGVHQLSHDDHFREYDWVSMVTLQIKIPDLNDLNQTLIRNYVQSKPIFSSESCWSGNIIQFAKRGGCHPERLRHQLWVHLLTGAALSMADMNGNNRSGFSESMDLKDKIQERHDIPKRIWDYMETIPFYRMNPHPELVDNGICLAEPGNRYLVYLPSGGTVQVKLDNREYKVEWINARDPKEIRSNGIARKGSPLTSPDNKDWLLLLTVHEKGSK